LNSVWPSLLANSADLLFNIGLVTRTPNAVAIENPWLKTSSASRFLPSRNVHLSRSFSCYCITRTIVDFDATVISAIWRYAGLESREYGRRESVTLTTWYPPKKLALTSPTSGGRSVDMVRSRTQATEFSFFSFNWR
jgi:hypothetical protein